MKLSTAIVGYIVKDNSLKGRHRYQRITSIDEESSSITTEEITNSPTKQPLKRVYDKAQVEALILLERDIRKDFTLQCIIGRPALIGTRYGRPNRVVVTDIVLSRVVIQKEDDHEVSVEVPAVLICDALGNINIGDLRSIELLD